MGVFYGVIFLIIIYEENFLGHNGRFSSEFSRKFFRLGKKAIPPNLENF